MATQFRLICALPAARAHLAERVLAAGGIPMVDLTCAPEAADVPEGAWIRVRTTEGLTGSGPVVLAAGTPNPTPVPGRPTWLELTEDEPVSSAFAGVILRGSEAGGPCGARPGLEMLRAMPKNVPVVLDAGVGPGDIAEVRLTGAQGVVLSDVLLGLPALDLPPGLKARLDRADATTSHLVNGFRIQAAPLAPVLRRLLSGSSFWTESKGWMRTDNPAEVAFPAGLGLSRAREVADRFADLESLLEALTAEVASSRPAPVATTILSADTPEPIAVVGLGCRLPGAHSVDDFWQMILESRNAIIEVPTERWDPALFWDTDKTVPDRTYAKIGGFLRDFAFNPRRFRIPPRMARSIDPVQQITLEAVADALEDAGLKAGPRDKSGKDFDRTACAVILGNSMGGEYTDDYTVRARVPAFQQALAAIPDFQQLPAATQQTILAAFGENVVEGLPPINEDAMPGELANVIAGRVANAFDLSGPNFTVDAACASSMAAVQAAVKGLQQGDFDMAVTGGADRSMGVATYTKFCKIGALSPQHSVPFDARADGFVMGEGAGILILKRVSDAERDGDRIYAVIKGIGGSSDGKGKGITAPNPRGQKYALSRAYESAGIDPGEVDLIEAHGTSTVVGDKVEVDSLSSFVGPGRRGGRGPMRIGSVKSNIGHLKSAAGAASLIKTSLAIHHGILPPSAGFESGRPDVAFDVIPLQVQTRPEKWDSQGPRRAGVSAFGFGGTNFHVVLEQAGASAEPTATPAAPPVEATPVPPGLWALSAEDRAQLVARAGEAEPAPFEPSAPIRVVAAAADAETRQGQLNRLRKSLQRGSDGAMLRSRGIALEEEAFDGKVAFLFTGQGSQYIGMGLKLAQRYPIVAKTFAEADRVMLPELGRPLTSFIRPDPGLSQAEQFARLQDTAISQPATLAVDIGILRLLAGFGVFPDMVAGHSLGEYAAVVASGIMSFEDALVAVSARGREMAAVKIDDPGRMAGIAAAEDVVIEVLAEIPGYVVAANKNCPTQTVIAGETPAVEAAMEAFRSRGITVHPLPVSHAFHTRVVAPASKPLRKVLERLDIRPPRRPITTNVTSSWYPETRGEILDLLSEQVAAPVEWIAQLERMYADGARVFVECGPKRALTGFVASTLKRRPHRAIFTNHPKVGELESFDNALAALVALGLPVRSEPVSTDIFAMPEARLASTQAIQQRLASRSAEPAPATGESATGYVLDEVLKLVGDLTGYAPEELNADDELEADLGVDTVKQAEVVARLRDRFQLEHDPNFRLSQLKSLRDLADYAGQRLGATRPAQLPPARTVSHAPLHLPSAPVPAPRPAAPVVRQAPVTTAAATSLVPASALQALAEGAVRAGLAEGTADAVAHAILPAFSDLIASLQTALAAAMPAPVAPPAPAPTPAPVAAAQPAKVSVVATGASLGLPGGDEIFGADNVARILSGENRIERLTGDDETDLLSRNIVRLKKDPKTGQGTFEPVNTRDQLIHLAGIGRGVNPADYGIDSRLAAALDITSVLAIGAGLEALRDAGIPLVEVTRTTGSGRKVTVGWKLPEALRDTTGVIFASAFPGYSNFAKHLQSNGNDGEGRFDRRFLFQVLGMGHSQFAQFIGARGPNTCINAACASTTQAVALAEDWIQMGRAERVVIVGADDVTNDQMLSWIGAGFLAAGAATTAEKVEEGALPFDARRNGMILGMGAVGLVLEREADAKRRGTTPIARLLATRIANSAFHGTRLDADHISAQVRGVVTAACEAAGVSPTQMARDALFMSHETYTPARGGSAAAEIFGLRAAFGDEARHVVVTNTKGFTGHPMGAGIEDAIAIKALQHEIIPPVPNLKVPDPDLGDLTLSSGGPKSVRFAVRLAAGFGSQLALAVWEAVGRGEQRTDAGAQSAWLQSLTGYGAPSLTVENRTLRVVEAQPAAAPKVAAKAPPKATVEAPSTPSVDTASIAALVREVLADKTGYDASEFEDDDELEADLGIDTVKQAEVLADLRERLGIPAEQEVAADGPLTIRRLIDAIAAAKGGAAGDATPAAPEAPEAPATPAAEVDRDRLLAMVRAVLADKTGYDPDEFEEEDELEADLGIDTVKQAEVLADLRERLGLPADAAPPTDGSPTVGGLADAMKSLVDNMGAPTPTLDDPAASDEALKPEDTLVPEGVPVDEPETKALPPTFRLRRPVIAPTAVVGSPRDLAGDIVVVLGEGPFADAIRAELTRRGCHVDPDLGAIGDAPVAAYFDAGQAVLDTFEAAKATHGLPPAMWVCATRLGADPSWVDPEVGLQHGARAGAAKSLGREWASTTARVIDVDPMLDDEEAARILVDEAACPDPTTEVFLDGRTRQAVRLVVEDVPPMGAPLRDNPVVVLTGGTRGVTARVALEMASRGPARMVLVARTAPGTEPLDEAATKAAIKAELKGKGERATPAKVEKRLKPLRKAEEARQTVERLRELGSEVHFVAADMRDESSVVAALEEARAKFGFIDGVVHGAGIEESRQLPDKSVADFKRIFEAKATGGMALARALGRVAWFVHMGSVAGRFGNAGQIDYSAANEALARVCLSRPRSLQVDWTAWADTGMAVRGGMQHLLESRGVDLLPADAGASLLVDLIAAGTSGELVVAGGLGNFDEQVAHPILERMFYDGDAVVCEARISKERSPWILDHAIDGTPVLPGVVGLELMAAAASRAAPGLALVGADSVAFSTPFKLYGDAESVAVVRAERTGPHSVACTLTSRREARGGRIIEAEHFSATIQLEHAPDVEPLPPAFFFAEDPVDKAAIYRRFFHGPGFQVMDEVGAIAANGLIADAVVDHSALGEGLLTRPLLLETAFQAAGLHRMAVEAQMALPESVEGVRWMGEASDGDRLGVMVQVRDDGAYDIDIDGTSGAVLRVRGFRMVVTGPLPDGDRFEVPEDGWPVVLKGAAVTPVKSTGPSAEHPYAAAARVWGEARGEAIPAHEREWLSARGRDRRITDRLAGQAAARAAVRAASGWDSTEFSVLRDDDGAPYALGPDDTHMAVSLTHADGGALAVAGQGAGRVGVDAERIVLRSPAFTRAWLTPAEQQRDAASALAVTRAWCAKEAVLKALGTGLRVHPRNVEVTHVVGRRLHITLTGDAADRFALLGGTALVCTWSVVDDLVVVGATVRCDVKQTQGVDLRQTRRSAG